MQLSKTLLKIASRAGGFAVADKLTANKLRVLCYHGFSFEDEHLFRPKLFMRASLFAARLAWLKKQNYHVLPLDEARERLKDGTLPSRSVVITIDDGFFSVAALACPLLKQYGFPATLYLTTYYCQNPNPIFRLVIQYFFWITQKKEVNLPDELPITLKIISPRGEYAEKIMWEIIEFGETKLSEPQRVELAKDLAERFDVSYERLVESRKLSLVTQREAASLARDGLDIQLHTHRHRLPANAEAVLTEIQDNRAVLSLITAQPSRHLCYPSGIWSKEVWSTLETLDVETATTCELGLVDANTPALMWPRILDADDLDELTFAAEVTGFKSSIRELRNCMSKKTH